MMKIMTHSLVIRCAIVIVVFVGCSRGTEKTLSGQVEIVNQSDNDLFNARLFSGDMENSFGIVSKKCSATMGFCSMALGDGLKIYWIERPKSMANESHRDLPAYESRFDLKSLDGFLESAGCSRFVYHGSGKWSLQLYSMKGFKKDVLLKEIDAEAPVKKENIYKNFK